MKLSLPISIILSVLTLALLPACSSDDDNEVEIIDVTYSNVSVTSFNLNADDSVLTRLDSVFFSIDLDNARIFNADSLPKGTDIHSLSVEIGLPSVTRAMIYFTGAEGRDSVDYLENSTDTIDFSHGPAMLSITSADGLASRNYMISVNVHEQDPDSLAWGSTAMRTLPTSLSAPASSRTTLLDGTYYCLTATASQACIATADNIEGDWQTRTVSLPAGARIETFSSADGKLFILDSADRLYSSANGGTTWSATGASMSHIYGAYGTELLGCLRRADGSYAQLSYPSATDPASAATLPEGCPVEGTSTLLVYTTDWASSATAITTGGTDATGTPTGASWAYDGTQWVCISSAPGTPRSGMSVIPYKGYRTSEFWVVTEYNVLLAFGGRKADGTNSNELWISFDRGIHWSRGMQAIQLPSYLPALDGASTFVADQTLTSSTPAGRSMLWKDYPDSPLPSRASIDSSWECPYIYIIGGTTGSGSLSNSIWRGAINRLTYRPLI